MGFCRKEASSCCAGGVATFSAAPYASEPHATAAPMPVEEPVTSTAIPAGSSNFIGSSARALLRRLGQNALYKL
jgi:hypothetical protein